MINRERLNEMAFYELQVKVKRKREDGTTYFDEINSNDIVPGDTILVPEGSRMPCDAILLNGECVVNEAMLTGESIPAIKTALPRLDREQVGDFSIENKDQCKYFLFSGTEIVQIRRPGQIGAIALVTRTGFSTTKGKLIRSIMYSAPKRFDFFRDTYYILAATILLAGLVLISVIPTFVKYFSAWHAIVRWLNTFSIAVPAALPIVISAATLIALHRLSQANIYCSISSRVSAAGRVSTMFFDKTGTLTHDGLNTIGFKLVEDKHFKHSNKTVKDILTNEEVWTNRDMYNLQKNTPNVRFIECMAS